MKTEFRYFVVLFVVGFLQGQMPSKGEGKPIVVHNWTLVATAIVAAFAPGAVLGAWTGAVASNFIHVSEK